VFASFKGSVLSFTCQHLKIESSTKKLVDIAFSFERSFALIGESGSGKSLTLKALLGMLPQTLSVDLDYDASYRLQKGKTVAFVPQNPFTALSPLTKISGQFMLEQEKAEAYLRKVELDIGFLERFPSELSGGQLQRIIIAMALSMEPKLLLLDEPTTALDEESKETILRLIKALQQSLGFDLLFVTHDIATITHLCEDVGIIHNGRLVEIGATQSVLSSPKEAYTQQLLASGFKQRSFRT
jgi:peptide/nickel transport system ATP-binding protein